MPAAKRNQSDSARIELFLDMLAAERGGTRNTLAAYAHDLADFSAHLIGAVSPGGPVCRVCNIYRARSTACRGARGSQHPIQWTTRRLIAAP